MCLSHFSFLEVQATSPFKSGPGHGTCFGYGTVATGMKAEAWEVLLPQCQLSLEPSCHVNRPGLASWRTGDCKEREAHLPVRPRPSNPCRTSPGQKEGPANTQNWEKDGSLFEATRFGVVFYTAVSNGY